MNKSVLVTGAAGFIGRHVAREFAAQGWYVVGMGRGDWSDWSAFGISQWHCCDVTLEALQTFAEKPCAIIHCAGGASVGNSVAEPYQDFIKTVDTMAQVLEFIRLHSPQTKLVYPSSASVYGQVSQLPIVENAPLLPISPYGFHKKMAESLCQLYAHQFGVSVAIVRLFSIYGAGLHKQLLWDACNKLSQGRDDFFGTGAEIRDWLHVKDAAQLIKLAADQASTFCPVVNGGSGSGVTTKEILCFVAEKMDVSLTPIFSSLAKEGDPNAYIADIVQARAWNWSPNINWRNGVAEYVEWFKQCQ